MEFVCINYADFKNNIILYKTNLTVIKTVVYNEMSIKPSTSIIVPSPEPAEGLLTVGSLETDKKEKHEEVFSHLRCPGDRVSVIVNQISGSSLTSTKRPSV